jgi:hypothetical protein
MIALDDRRYADAESHLLDALTVARRTEERLGTVVAFYGLAVTALAQGDAATARARLTEGLSYATAPATRTARRSSSRRSRTSKRGTTPIAPSGRGPVAADTVEHDLAQRVCPAVADLSCRPASGAGRRRLRTGRRRGLRAQPRAGGRSRPGRS